MTTDYNHIKIQVIDNLIHIITSFVCHQDKYIRNIYKLDKCINFDYLSGDIQMLQEKKYFYIKYLDSRLHTITKS